MFLNISISIFIKMKDSSKNVPWKKDVHVLNNHIFYDRIIY